MNGSYYTGSAALFFPFGMDEAFTGFLYLHRCISPVDVGFPLQSAVVTVLDPVFMCTVRQAKCKEHIADGLMFLPKEHVAEEV